MWELNMPSFSDLYNAILAVTWLDVFWLLVINLLVYFIIYIFFTLIPTLFKSPADIYNEQKERADKADSELKELEEEKPNFIIKHIGKDVKLGSFPAILRVKFANIGNDSVYTRLHLFCKHYYNKTHSTTDKGEVFTDYKEMKLSFSRKIASVISKDSMPTEVCIDISKDEAKTNIMNFSFKVDMTCYAVLIISKDRRGKFYYFIEYFRGAGVRIHHAFEEEKEILLKEFGNTIIEEENKTLNEICNEIQNENT